MTKKKSSTLTNKKSKGPLIIVGGGEDRKQECLILKEIAERTGNGKMIIATLASRFGKENFEEYKRIFQSFGVKSVSHFTVKQPAEAHDPKLISMFDQAKSVFFTGGDQLKITTRLGGTPILDRIIEIHETGGVIAGTSAGASAMGKTMLVGRDEKESHKINEWHMAPGLGLVENIIIDQHFGQRGRIGRLLGAIALNPGMLGIGIDEDTAVILEGNRFRVLGSSAVYVIDGHSVTHTNVSEAQSDRTMSMHNVLLNILCDKQEYDISTYEAYAESLK